PHVVHSYGDGNDLLHVDRHLLHDLGGGAALVQLRMRGLAVRNPDLTFATVDHVVTTDPESGSKSKHSWALNLIDSLRNEAVHAGIRLHDVGESGQGIVHVAAPEIGFTLPG